MLPILDISDYFNFQEKGNYENVKWGLLKYGLNNNLSFFFKRDNPVEITIFKAFKVNIIGKEVELIEEIDLIAYKPTIYNGGYEFLMKLLDSIFSKGLYYFYMTDTFYENKSEIFCIGNDLDITTNSYSIDYSYDYTS